MMLKKFTAVSLVVVSVLSVITIFQLLGFSKDYQHYLNLYNYSQTEIQANTKEVYFVFVRFLLNDILNAPFYFFIFSYVFLSLSLKFYAISSFSKLPFVSFFVYLFIYFPLHDYTQIRTAVASAIFLFILHDLSESKFFWAIIKTGIATLFHWSALTIAFVWLLYYFRFKYLYIYLPILGMMLYFSKGAILDILLWLSSFNEYTELYFRSHSGHEEVFNIFNVLFILNIAFWVALVVAAEKNREIKREAPSC